MKSKFILYIPTRCCATINPQLLPGINKQSKFKYCLNKLRSRPNLKKNLSKTSF